MTKLSNEIIAESQKVLSQTTDKIKSGFVSLLNSVSNSFASLKKTFSFSAGNEMKRDRKDSACLRTVPSIVIDNTTMNCSDGLSSTSSREREFNQLKAEMHERLNACFNYHVNN